MQTNTLTTSSFTATRRGVKVPEAEQRKLRDRLHNWRNEKHRQYGLPIFLSAQVILPPKQMDAFVMQSARLLQEQTLTTHLLRKLVPWDSATESDMEELQSIISDWRDTASIAIPTTPTSQRRARKKKRAEQPRNLTTTPQARPVTQPNFTSHLTPQTAQPITQPTFTSRFRLPAPPRLIQPLSVQSNLFIDENVFQTPHQHTPMPGPSSYAAAVSSKPTPSTILSLHAQNNPYQQFPTPTLRATYAPLHNYSPFAPSGLSWTPTPSTPVHQRPLVQYQFASNYTPLNFTPQSRR